jgi:hypothetical protein
MARDAETTSTLEGAGWTVMRFWAQEDPLKWQPGLPRVRGLRECLAVKERDRMGKHEVIGLPIGEPRLAAMAATARAYILVGPVGKPYRSQTPGTLGGNRRGKLYGRLDCRPALRAIAKGGYAKHACFSPTSRP